MEFQVPVTFYYESPVKFYENSDEQNGYLYSSVTVIPATTIYYEDEFLTYDGDWATDGTQATATQAQDRPGAMQIFADLDADNVYGYDGAYASMAGASMGSSHKISVSSGKDGMASFDFYGTGFDVISMTDTTTGTIFVRVFAYGEDGTLSDSPAASHVVDTYYGYARNYYKVVYTYTNGAWTEESTVITADQMGTSGTRPENPTEGASYIKYTTGWTTVTSNNPNALYQVPVMKISGLPYGKYQAQIVAAYDEFFDNQGDGSYDFYLDAIRIYDPTGNENAEANAAYVKDGEGWPIYEEVRNYVIDANTFDSLDDTAISGIVFIDGLYAGDSNTGSVTDYTSYGPNNELYLTSGQAVAFDLEAVGDVAKVQMALKTVGGTGSVKVYGVKTDANDDGTATTTTVTALDTAISTATDMYYDITDLNNMTVVIVNTGANSDAVVSITNVKTTFNTEPAAAEPLMVFSVRRSSVDAALMSLRVDEAETEVTEPETEVTEPETEVTEPETEATEPETEATEPETEATEPETEPAEPETEPTEPEESKPSVEEQVNGLVNKVKTMIKQLFGWLFG